MLFDLSVSVNPVWAVEMIDRESDRIRSNQWSTWMAQRQPRPMATTWIRWKQLEDRTSEQRSRTEHQDMVYRNRSGSKDTQLEHRYTHTHTAYRQCLLQVFRYSVDRLRIADCIVSHVKANGQQKLLAEEGHFKDWDSDQLKSISHAFSHWCEWSLV